MVLHFIYSFRRGETAWQRGRSLAYRKALGLLGHAQDYPRHLANEMPLEERCRSPFSITHHLYRALSAHFDVKLYHLLDQGNIDYGKNDAILGHPWLGDHYLMNRALLENKTARFKAMILPMEKTTIDRFPHFKTLMDRADLIFTITGTYWWKEFQRPPYDRWSGKMKQLDMALDVSAYPFLRKKFNPPGQRGYLYIGRNSPFKGIPVLSESMRQLAPLRSAWIGAGEDIPYIPRLSHYRNLDANFAQSLIRDFDFFVNTSTSDANPTTILESMAWGYPIACTDQSGYDQLPNQIKLRVDDPAYNAKVLAGLQDVPETELLKWTHENRSLVEKHFTWAKFCNIVTSPLVGLA